MSTLQIPLTQGKFAIIDEADAEAVLAHKWYAVRRRNGWYAAFAVGPKHSRRQVLMHRLLLGDRDGSHIDHVNGDGLDNRRENLRHVSVAQNQWNRSRPRNNSSGFKGVSWVAQKQLWRADITANGISRCIGYYSTKEDAARAYDMQARALHGEFAVLNLPD